MWLLHLVIAAHSGLASAMIVQNIHRAYKSIHVKNLNPGRLTESKGTNPMQKELEDKMRLIMPPGHISLPEKPR